ncbi:MAG TPA: class I tRNA ligase family protein, partial [Cyclobacteriaceae bacterium]|nr:class I tRNA ligase family protein [Cyclobacteriaceae bacterium]
LNDHFSKFRMSDALLTVYKLTWDDFCAWYLEIIKPEFGKPIDQATYTKTIEFFETILKLLHPFMPFITEELWHELKVRNEKDCIILASWPKEIESVDYSQATAIETVAFNLQQNHVEKIKAGIGFIRKIRQKDNLKNNELTEVYVTGSVPELIILNKWKPIIENLSGSTIQVLEDPIFPKGTYEAHFEGSMQWNVKKKEENKNELIRDLEYYRGFLTLVNTKLQNAKFVISAPAHVIEMERIKKADAETKIKSLEEKLNNLNSSGV